MLLQETFLEKLLTHLRLCDILLMNKIFKWHRDAGKVKYGWRIRRFSYLRECVRASLVDLDKAFIFVISVLMFL